MKIHPSWKIEAPDNQNIRAMLSYPLDYYKKRLQKIGFYGQKTKLLDAGCGAGHWSIAASYQNKDVKGIDSTENYLNVARRINQRFKRKNLKFILGQMEALPYPDDYFDFVFSYCAWMYTNRVKSLREMNRVLKPGGKIYLGAVADIGWYPQLIWQGLKNGNRNLIIQSIKALCRRIETTEKEARDLLIGQGLKTREINFDGQIGEKEVKVQPIYQKKFLLMRIVYEVLAEKE